MMLYTDTSVHWAYLQMSKILLKHSLDSLAQPPPSDLQTMRVSAFLGKPTMFCWPRNYPNESHSIISYPSAISHLWPTSYVLRVSVYPMTHDLPAEATLIQGASWRRSRKLRRQWLQRWLQSCLSEKPLGDAAKVWQLVPF